MKLIVDTFEFGTQYVPQWNTISISGYQIREAGSTALQELAFTLYDGIEYIEWARGAGLDIDDFAPRLSFFFNAHNDLFEEIAKYRAARKVWHKGMIERFHSKNPRSAMLAGLAAVVPCVFTWAGMMTAKTKGQKGADGCAQTAAEAYEKFTVDAGAGALRTR